MERKIRTWTCKCCGICKPRKKNESGYEFAPRCNNCDKDMVSSRKYTKWKECKHSKLRNKIEIEKDKYYSKLRDNYGATLRVSPETKRLWKKVNVMKTKPSMIKHSNAWLISLNNDLFRESNSWKKEFRDNEIVKSRGGICSTPKVLLTNKNPYHKGLYVRQIFAGKFQIEVCEGESLFDMKNTLLHETLHYIDDISSIPSKHDCYFFKRLELMKGVFKVR